MAKNEYELNININKTSGGNSPIASSIYGENAPQTNEQSQAKVLKSLGAFVATSVVEPYIKKNINFITSNVQLATGSTELATRTNTAMGIAQYSMKTVSNVASMTLLSGGNIFAGIIGGVGLTLFDFATDQINRERKLQLNRTIENKQLAQLRDRAGASFNQSRRNGA